MAAEGRVKVCPVCGAPGTGPYARWVLNDRKQRFGPYFYFAHKAGRQIQWCYIGKAFTKELSNQHQTPETPSADGKMTRCRRCRNFATVEGRPFCLWLQAVLTPETFDQPCGGVKAKLNLKRKRQKSAFRRAE